MKEKSRKSPTAPEDASPDSITQVPEPENAPITTEQKETAEANGETDTKEAIPPQPAPDIEAMLIEAEQKGYLRGRNESIEELMRRPSMMQILNPSDSIIPETEEPMILSNPRTSIWER